MFVNMINLYTPILFFVCINLDVQIRQGGICLCFVFMTKFTTATSEIINLNNELIPPNSITNNTELVS